MAGRHRGSYDDDDEYYGEDENSPYEGFSHRDTQEFLYDIIGFLPGESFDSTAHDLFYQSMYNDDLSLQERQEMLEELQDYLYDTYGVFFADYWDWDDFRAWYAAQ